LYLPNRKFVRIPHTGIISWKQNTAGNHMQTDLNIGVKAVPFLYAPSEIKNPPELIGTFTV
jgi:hypothetical protein